MVLFFLFSALLTYQDWPLCSNPSVLTPCLLELTTPFLYSIPPADSLSESHIVKIEEKTKPRKSEIQELNFVPQVQDSEEEERQKCAERIDHRAN